MQNKIASCQLNDPISLFSANNGREIKKRKPSKIPPPPFESARLVSCCLNSPDTDTKAEKKKKKIVDIRDER